jgi:hypothetical protein
MYDLLYVDLDDEPKLILTAKGLNLKRTAFVAGSFALGGLLLSMSFAMKKNKKYKIDERFKDMTAEEKLNLSLRLYHSAWELKKAALAHFNPGITEEELEKRVKEIFFYARS